jgi:NAD(P)-dependent dehydrogenase (short-subunit alcohol dehydrogenase family)
MTTGKLTAVVTGASRGLGRGVARALGAKGAKVYLTARPSSLDMLHQAAEEVSAAGGKGIPLPLDHRDDEQVRAAFERVAVESPQLDLLVNNAAAVHDELILPGGFWEKPLRLVDMIDVGLRSSYVASYFAASLMVARRRGLIANISFYGAVSYFHGPAYGAAKAGTDKMSFDMAVDLRPHNVACVSLWPGFVFTDRLAGIQPETLPPDLAAALPSFERPEFTGLVLDALSRDPQLMMLSGCALIGAELAERYAIKDIDGKQPVSHRAALGKPFEYSMPPAR